MPSEVTHVALTLDQAMLQTIRMGLSAIQLAAAQVEAHLNKAVQAAIEEANRPVEVEPEPEVARPPPRTSPKGVHA